MALKSKYTQAICISITPRQRNMIEKISDKEEQSLSEAARSLVVYGIERWLGEHGLDPHNY
jgi:hypothetical protein